MVISKFVTSQMCLQNEFCVSFHLIKTSCHLTICIEFSIDLGLGLTKLCIFFQDLVGISKLVQI
jgi:hypothetical protein